MKKIDALFRATFIFLLLTCVLFVTPASASINPQIDFYGTLQNDSGVNLTGTYDIVFRIYDSPTGGTLLGTNTHTAANGNPVSVTNGKFAVVLGSGTGNSLAGVDFNNSALYVGLTINADSEMTPRERMTAAPYAFNSEKLEGYRANQLLRYNATGSITDSSSDTILSVRQDGAGNILSLFGGATEMFTVLSNGNVGVGTSSPIHTFTVAGDAHITGGLYDSANSAGTFGMVLQTSGTTTRWVATSTLGITGGGGSSLFTDGGATTYLTAVGDNVAIGTTTANTKLTVAGTFSATGTSTLATTTISFSNITTLNLVNALAITSGGTGATTASGARTNLGATTVGANIFTLTNPSALSFLQINADNTVSAVATSTLGIALSDTTGILAATRGGTGLGTITQNQLLIGGAGNTWSQIATSSLGLSASFSNSAQLAGLLSDESGTGSVAFTNSPTLVTPNLGTPTTLIGTNITGTASGLTAGTVTTNANLTGAITSTGNATVLGSFTSANLSTALTDETGTGAAVFAGSPTFTGILNADAATLSSAFTLSGSAANITLGSNYLSGDGGDEGIFIDSVGNMGLGTTTPSSILTIGQTATNSALTIYGAGAAASSRGSLFVTNTGVFAVQAGGSTGIGALVGSTGQTVAGWTDTSIAVLSNKELGFGDTLNFSTGFNSGDGSLRFVDGDDISSSTLTRLLISSGGNIGIGTTTPNNRLTVAGSFLVTGTSTLAGVTVTDLTIARALRDGVNSIGTSGMVLQTTGTSTRWVATSTLGITGGGGGATTFLALTDTPSFYTANRVMFTNSGATDLIDSPNFTFDGSVLSVIGSTTASEGFYINQTPAILASTTQGAFFMAGAVVPPLMNELAYNNLAMGTGSMQNLLRGSANIALGFDSLAGSSTGTMVGNRNIAIGDSTLFVNQSGNDNIALGSEALFSNDSGGGNVAIGRGNLYSNISGAQNNAIGAAMGLNTIGSYNNAMGAQTLDNNISGDYNNAFGRDAAVNNISGSHNNAIGYRAMRFNQTGDYNNAIGLNALNSNIDGSFNVALGAQALFNNNGTGTIAIGWNSGYNALSVSRGIFIGSEIDAASTTENNVLNIGNIIFGKNIDGTGTTISSGNIGIGSTSPSSKLTVAGSFSVSGTSTLAGVALTDLTITRALRDGVNSVGTNNMILQTTGTSTRWVATSTLGTSASFTNSAQLAALLSDETGGGSVVFAASPFFTGTASFANINVFTGSAYQLNSVNVIRALTSTSNYFFGNSGNLSMTGSDNISLGRDALRFNTTGSSSTAVGREALNANTTGQYNTGLGANSLFSNTTGSNNTAVGALAGFDMSTATGTGANTFLGYNTGRGITTGINNTILGANVTGLSSALSNNIIIADGAGNQRININATGSVGIGTSTPSAQLTTTGTVRFAAFGAGTLQTDANGNVSVSSDERLKDIMGDFTKGLEELSMINPIQYTWKPSTGYDTNNVYTGFSAQNIKDVLPEAVGENANGYLSLSDRPLLATVINAIKQVYAWMKTTDTRVEKLESQVNTLQSEINALKEEKNETNNETFPTPEVPADPTNDDVEGETPPVDESTGEAPVTENEPDTAVEPETTSDTPVDETSA